MASVQRIKAAHGSPAWFHDMVERSKTEGVFAEVVTLTPALANEILKDNPHNRQISRIKKTQLVRDIEEGRWVFNGESILISVEGLLNDGQHRAEACVDANKPIQTIMIFGVSRESRLTLDQGSKRQAADFLHMMGHKYATLSAAVGRLVIAYEKSGGRHVESSHNISATEIVKRFIFDDDMIDSCHFAMTTQHQITGIIHGSSVGLCHHVMKRFSRDQAEHYLSSVFMGTNVEIGDIAYTVRNTLIHRERLTRGEKLCAVFTGWDALRRGETLKRRMSNLTNELPKLI